MLLPRWHITRLPSPPPQIKTNDGKELSVDRKLLASNSHVFEVRAGDSDNDQE